MKSSLKYNCIFGGGDIRGMAYIGVIKALKEFNIEIESIAGSSVGSVFAFLYALGYNEDEIRDIFFDFNINMFRDLNINLFTNDISISKGEIFLEWLREKAGRKIYGNKYENQKIRFKDLETDLYILTLDFNTNTPYIFSKDTTPDEEIAVAVRASAGLPGLMKPINFGNSLLVDGDLIKSWPAWKIYDKLNNSGTRMLELRLEGSRDGSDIKNPMDYLNSIINTIWYLSTENVFNDYATNDRYDYIVIDAKDVILFDFTIDKTIKSELIDKGYHAAKEYLSTELPKKKKIIIEKYEKILSKIKILTNALNQNNPRDILFTLNDILSDMYEDTKYIDISIYEKIKELKECITMNTKKQFLFPEKIVNEKQIKERNEFIKLLVEERINELREYINKFSNKS